jgi:predicted DNA-binding transcriptional regulator AlpA
MNEKRIQAAAVRQLCGGVSDMWIWRRLRDDPSFPKPTYVGRRRFWREADIIAWLEAQGKKTAA